MTPWHSDVFGIESIHLTLLYYSPPTICSSVIIDSWLPRAKLCCFSAKSDRCDSRARRSDGPKRYNRASMNFNTFAGCVFLRLPRSYRVAEKSDPIARFSGPDRRKSWKIDGFYRISRRRDTIEPNGENFCAKCIDRSALNFVAPEHAWATNGELARFQARTQKQPYYLFFVLFFT